MTALSDLFIGVQTRDLPTITTAGVSASPINIAGLLIGAERGTNKVHKLTSSADIETIFGRHRLSYYGHYTMTGFFKNLQGESGVLYAKRTVPSDAVAATDNISNGTNDTWTIEAGRLGLTDPGTWGNQLWYTVLASSRGGALSTAALTGAETTVAVDTVAPFAIGDWVDVDDTTNTWQGIISAIDESTNTLTLSIANAGANAIGIGATVNIVDRTIKVYKKDSANGNVDLVETIENVTISETSGEFYYLTVINEVDSGSNWLLATDIASAEDGTFADFPAVVADDFANAVQLTTGVDGTTLTTTQYAAELLAFDPFPVKYLTNTEVHSEAIWDDGEIYCKTRGDCVWVGCPTEELAFSAAEKWSFKRQKSRKVYAWNEINWVRVDDPIGAGAFPLRNVPPLGHIIGYSIYLTTLRGIHKVPASTRQTLVGVRSVVGEFLTRAEIRDLANAGSNCITELSGSFALRSGRSPSKLAEWKFVNALNMSIYFKSSFETSFTDLENEPNQVVLIARLRDSILSFALVFFTSSSNGGSESGFHSFRKPNGSISGFEDVVVVDTGDSVNPIRDINAGVLKANFYFMAPPPAERILVGVGLLFIQ